jgi:hypothetical protein
MRGAWENIVPSETCLIDDVKDCNKLILKMMSNMAYEEELTNDADFRQFAKCLLQLKAEQRRPIAVDATKLEDSWADAGQPDALFFECPWGPDVPSLIHNFLRSAKAIQKTGDLLFLGICSYYYFGRYNLQPTYEGYHMLGVDVEFTKKMRSRGYTHQTGYGPEAHGCLSDNLADSFVTLCYEKN